MKDNDSSETNLFMGTHEMYQSVNKTINCESEARILTQEEVDEHIKIFIAPVTRQLEDLTRLIQVSSTAHRPNLFRRTGIRVSFSAAGPSPDNLQNPA